MGQRGPLPAPHSLRTRDGRNTSKRKSVGIPIEKIGRAKIPRWLDGLGLEFWKQLAPELESRGLLTTFDQAAFSVLCCAYEGIRHAEHVLAKGGLVISGPRGGGKPQQ